MMALGGISQGDLSEVDENYNDNNNDGHEDGENDTTAAVAEQQEQEAATNRMSLPPSRSVSVGGERPAASTATSTRRTRTPGV
ncbi:hypothetical protein PsorP6_009686 [Peronosclerospora sorghi]|uniref:Uncharacterized protein n=1 Tax=Peronosclerospora sorghi TaxID=230839 RepID=A0ACC0VYZ6_9STRA|nr:hypothetical protein PsorP6_009686 [Peronosclerospora sorghi]